MRPSRIVLLLVAILAGGLAAFLATRGGDRPVEVVQGPEVVVEEKKTQILVAVANIGMGQRLSPKTVEWQDWPEGAVRADYITVSDEPDALEQITGAVARFEIFPGDPVSEQKLVRSEQGYLSAILEQGKRGISIGVSAESSSGGFIVPNDHVDIVLTRSGPNGRISETIMYNVRVLAINKRLGETGATGAPSDPDSPRAEVFGGGAIATLELDPAQGETLINASRIGQLSLALRSIADFGEDPNEAANNRRPANQAVRMIKYGQESNVMPGTAVASAEDIAAEAGAVVEPTIVSEPEPMPGAPVVFGPEPTTDDAE